MIQITMDKGVSSIKMDGTDREIFAEATAIVNALYMAIEEDNPALGRLFQACVRWDDSVWKGGVITESTKIVMSGAGAGK